LSDLRDEIEELPAVCR